MVDTRQLDAADGEVVLLVGTTKGAFLFGADAGRGQWRRGGPYFPGLAVYAMGYDGRGGRRRLWAAPESAHWGATLRGSDDFGRTWTDEKQTLRFPEATGGSLKRVWQIGAGRERDVLFCGVEPAALFVSRDAGESWSLVQPLWDHPHRPKWEPGGGGLCLHTVLPHPDDSNRILVAISAAGVYATEDGGASWHTSHRGVRADFLPEKHPEFGQCVHKVGRDPQQPERLFLQNHWGLYRSDDGGASWQDVANGVPSDFGFALAVHPRRSDRVYIVPLESDQFRCVPEGRLRVYRTDDGGGSWQPLSNGLPQDAFETVLRDALCLDGLDPAGAYFGTRSGKLFGSSDEGESWRLIADGLPPVVCMKSAVAGSAS